MARIYNLDDTVKDFLDFLVANSGACDEAIVWLRKLDDLTLGEFLDVIKNNDSFEAGWVAYSVLKFPKVLCKEMMDALEVEMNRSPKARGMVNSKPPHKRAAKELTDG